MYLRAAVVALFIASAALVAGPAVLAFTHVHVTTRAGRVDCGTVAHRPSVDPTAEQEFGCEDVMADRLREVGMVFVVATPMLACLLFVLFVQVRANRATSMASPNDRNR